MKEAAKGAESVGAEVEYIDLYKLDLHGCMSCLICKKLGKERCKCYWKADLSPLIERILDADNLIIGSPIYLSEPTSHYRALLERLIFCILSYDNHSSYYKGKVNVALFYTMNAPKDYYETMMKQYLESSAQVFHMLNGEVEIYPVFNTLQVNDYSKYSMAAFDEKNKKLNHEKQFPIDLETAFKIGARLSK
ncbi:NADPH-dependent FMN reductase [Methanobrevibacter millerae]|uniref:NADPH-dependent FMN reductase n=1 Tax=Methanobrevibacter millerae TaxID=230361 RepID=A0A0U3CT77_9EURY|nr:flavodoxin family protein [Methanobrevibacter millerae]ALT68879.1 NADPH-dependent FMN reductase [Methanobrevibacter millerae]